MSVLFIKRFATWPFAMFMLLLSAGVAYVGENIASTKKFEAACTLNLTPAPQWINLYDETISAKGVRIAFPGGVNDYRAGLEFIKTRFALMGISPQPEIVVNPYEANIIVGCGSNPEMRKSAREERLPEDISKLGEQGYRIDTITRKGKKALLVRGTDRTGILYACVTLANLIVRDKNGDCGFRLADIRDWPDFKLRDIHAMDFRKVRYLNKYSFKRGDDEKLFKHFREQLDTCFSYKLNRVHSQLAHMPRPEDPLFKRKMELIGKIADYAWARGIVFRILGSSNVYAQLTPEQLKDAITIKRFGHTEAYCYSTSEAHRANAGYIRRYLKWFPRVIFCLHPIDAGAYHNPALWSRRGEADRKKFGNDRVSATIAEATPYYQMVKALNPENEFILVPLPYHFQFALPDYPERYRKLALAGPGGRMPPGINNKDDARKYHKQLSDFSRKLGDKLDDEIYITFREAGRDTFLACGDLYKNHPVDVWIYLGKGRGWRGSFIPQARFFKTFYRAGFRDYIYSEGFQSFGAPEVLMAAYAEYLWNTNTPDSSPSFTIFSRQYENPGNGLSDYQRDQLIPKICRGIYGSAAPEMIPVYTSDLSLNYVVMLKKMAWSWDTDMFDSPYKYLQSQRDKLQKVSEGLKELFVKLRGGEVKGPYGNDLRKSSAYGAVLYYVKYLPLLLIKAELELPVAKAEAELERQSPENAEKILHEAMKKIPELKRETVEWLKTMSPYEKIIVATPIIPAQRKEEKILDKLDPNSDKAVYQALLDRIEQTRKGGDIPPHVRKLIKEHCRVNVARMPTGAKFNPEGAPDAREWREAEELDFFTNRNGNLAKYQTIAHLAWDDKYLYFSARMLGAPPKSPAKYFWGQDAVELILRASGRGKKPVAHFAVNMKNSKKGWVVKSGSNVQIPPDVWRTGVMTRTGEWSAETAISMDYLQKILGNRKNWMFNIRRRRPYGKQAEVSCYLRRKLHGKSVMGWSMINFSDRTGLRRNDNPVISCSDISRKNQAISYASVTLLRFVPEVSSDTFIPGAKLVAVVSRNGKQIIRQVVDIGPIPGHWKPSLPMTLDLGGIYGGKLVLTLTITRYVNCILRKTSKRFIIDDTEAK